MKKVIYLDDEGYSWEVVKIKDNGTSYFALECIDYQGRQEISAIQRMKIKVIKHQY